MTLTLRLSIVGTFTGCARPDCGSANCAAKAVEARTNVLRFIANGMRSPLCCSAGAAACCMIVLLQASRRRYGGGLTPVLFGLLGSDPGLLSAVPTHLPPPPQRLHQPPHRRIPLAVELREPPLLREQVALGVG